MVAQMTGNFTSNDSQVLVEEYHELVSTNYLGFASFVVLAYDHILTVDDEVKYIWHTSKTKPIIILFLLNRYLTPLGFIVNLNAYISPAWSFETCHRFVVYEGIMGFVGVAIASLMMLIRIHAIYHGDRLVLSFMWILFFAMLGINIWLLMTSGPVLHPGINWGCSMLFGQTHRIGTWVSATAWSPMIFDTAVIVLVVIRTRAIVRGKIADQSKVVTALFQDGIMYYGVILTINLVLAAMIVKAPDGVKNICAQFQLILTVTMMSRITLNLRKNMDKGSSLQSLTVPIGDSRVQIQLRDIESPPRVLRKQYSISRGS